MNLEQLAYLAEIIGVIAVVITLIYLSVQIRQGAQILWSESRQAQVAYDQGGVYKFVEHPELGRLFSQIETPTAEEKTKLMFWMIGQMRAREHEWLQYRTGALDEETWVSYRDVILFSAWHEACERTVGSVQSLFQSGFCRNGFENDRRSAGNRFLGEAGAHILTATRVIVLSIGLLAMVRSGPADEVRRARPVAVGETATGDSGPSEP